MVASFIGSALVSSTKAMKKLANKKVVGIVQEEIYSHKTIEKVEGEIKENLVLKLLPLLQGNVENFTALAGSALDCEVKADVVAVFENCTYAFQVKSSERAAEAHMKKTCRLNDKKIAPPGVIWIESGTHPLLVLKELSSFLGVPIREDVISALELAKKFRKKSFLLKSFKLTKEQLAALQLLNIAKVEGANIVF